MKNMDHLHFKNMLSKNQILSNPREFSAEQIAEAINAGVVSMYELSKSGYLTPLLRKRIQSVLDGGTVPSTDMLGRDSESKIEEAKIKDSEEYDFPSNVILSDDVAEDSTPPVSIDQEYSSDTVDFSEEKVGMFRHPFSFKGRIRRTEYWISTFIYMVWYSLLEFSAIMVEQSDKNVPLFIIALMLTIPAVWFMWAQGAKRCHDRGNSGWYQLIPFYGFWMLFAGSEDGDNEYGKNPKNNN